MPLKVVKKKLTGINYDKDESSLLGTRPNTDIPITDSNSTHQILQRGQLDLAIESSGRAVLFRGILVWTSLRLLECVSFNWTYMSKQ